MWRCVNNIFGYCKGEPEFAVQPVSTGAMSHGKCVRDYHTCDLYDSGVSPAMLSPLPVPPQEQQVKASTEELQLTVQEEQPGRKFVQPVPDPEDLIPSVKTNAKKA